MFNDELRRRKSTSEAPHSATCCAARPPAYPTGPRSQWIEAVTAVVLRDGAPSTAEELITHCRESLSDFKSPKHIAFAGQLPKNASGKLPKRELRTRVRAPWMAPAATDETKE
ncbi:AMP-binding enzyme [Streptomyces sp. NPDC002765]